MTGMTERAVCPEAEEGFVLWPGMNGPDCLLIRNPQRPDISV